MAITKTFLSFQPDTAAGATVQLTNSTGDKPTFPLVGWVTFECTDGGSTWAHVQPAWWSSGVEWVGRYDEDEWLRADYMPAGGSR
jgi:hypothetical protein